MWKWKTLCQATAPHEFTRFTPSARRRCFARPARRWPATATASRSSRPTLSRSGECTRGITSACPRVAGLMSMKAIVRSSSSTIVAGISPARILQKMQSGSAIAGSLDALGSGQRAGVGERLLWGGELPGVLRLGDRQQQLADTRADRDLELGGQLVTANH